MILHQYWFINCNTCTTLKQMLIGEIVFGKVSIWEFSAPCASYFCKQLNKPETALKTKTTKIDILEFKILNICYALQNSLLGCYVYVLKILSLLKTCCKSL